MNQMEFRELCSQKITAKDVQLATAHAPGIIIIMRIVSMNIKEVIISS